MQNLTRMVPWIIGRLVSSIIQGKKMIIYLDIKVEELTIMPPEEAETIFTLLLDADRLGNHMIVISRTTCDWAIENLSLSGQNSNHLNRLKADFSTRGNIRKYSKCHISVVFGESEIYLEGSGFSIGHKKFISSEFSTYKTRMIVENIENDSGLYNFMFSVAIKQTNIPGTAVDFVSGGGSTTCAVFENEIKKNRIAICIVDTDKNSPCDKLGSTAKKVLNLHNKRNIEQNNSYTPYIGTATTTIGQEIENYIPFNAVKQISCYNLPPELELIVKQNTSADAENCFWLFFDLKNGVSGTKILDKIDQGLKQRSVGQWIASRLGCSYQDLKYKNINGVGKNIIEKFLSTKEAQNEYIEFSKTEYWRSAFLAQFESLLWYLAATMPVRT
ncbi:hypothetical protein [Roseibium aggregatum]|uniref:hypothetical protein n=1 Tax=Roseibium aggregatum TaxID=187304 RepID=UPI001A904595|nr:hypothetical protein [Roseibium aggregatum]MBN8180990.1 hypothetical protein [Roseibium aggregatum]